MLPFLGAGHTHVEGDYQQLVGRGLDYLKGRMVHTANGGDPVIIRGKAAVEVVLPDFSAEAFENLSFECSELDLLNPDVNEDGLEDYTIGNGIPGPLTCKLYERFVGLQYGEGTDDYGWTRKVCDR